MFNTQDVFRRTGILQRGTEIPTDAADVSGLGLFEKYLVLSFCKYAFQYQIQSLSV